MRDLVTYAFIDGGYLRCVADDVKTAWIDPSVLSVIIANKGHNECSLMRVLYYDAILEDKTPESNKIKKYCGKVELLPDTHLRMGVVRGHPPRQKGVDTFIAADMIVGAFQKQFDVAILIAGDADFLPVIQEVGRRGVTVIVAGQSESTSRDLIKAADRFVEIPSEKKSGWFPELKL